MKNKRLIRTTTSQSSQPRTQPGGAEKSFTHKEAVPQSNRTVVLRFTVRPLRKTKDSKIEGVNCCRAPSRAGSPNDAGILSLKTDIKHCSVPGPSSYEKPIDTHIEESILHTRARIRAIYTKRQQAT
jgi:hypothetical protein